MRRLYLWLADFRREIRRSQLKTWYTLWALGVALLITAPPLSGKPPLLLGVVGGNTPAAMLAGEGKGSLVDLWQLFDAAATKAFQAQAYEESADISLLSYLVALSIDDVRKTYLSARRIAGCYHFLGNTDSALTAYRLALDSAISGVPAGIFPESDDSKLAALDKNHFVVETFLNLGVLCVNAQKLDSAKIYFRRTMELATLEIPSAEGGRLGIEHVAARAKAGLADVYEGEGNYDEAITLYQESRVVFEAQVRYLQLRERIRSMQAKRSAMLAGIKMNLAQCLRSLGSAYMESPRPSLSDARKYLEQCLQLYEGMGNAIYTADAKIALSQLALTEHRFQDALLLSTSAVELTTPGTEGDNPDLRWPALLVEGQSLLELDRFSDAAAALKQSIATVEDLKNPDIGNEERSSFFNSVTWFFRQKVSPYSAMADLMIRQEKPLEALQYAELAKARTLLLGHAAGTDSKGGSLGSTTFTLDQLVEALQTDIPDEKTAALEYLRCINKDYAFLVTRDATNRLIARVKLITIGTSSGDLSGPGKSNAIPDLDSTIARFRGQIEKSYAAYPQVLGRALYTALLKPFENELVDKKHLILVPTGKLWELPFQALIVPSEGRTSYLVEAHSVSYSPSLLFLGRLLTRSTRVTRGQQVLLLSNLVSGDRVGSASVFDPVKAVFSADALSLRCKVFVGSEATPERFLQEAPRAGLVILSTHAIIGGADPTQAYFSLAPEADGNDRLTAASIMDLPFKANLVLLGACETELGRYVEGEGEIGLGWAFLYAGCSGTIVSQWKIDRDASWELTVRFCRALADQLRLNSAQTSIADLLRSTQLALLSDERYSHPSYWAGMVLVGDPFWHP